MSRLQQELRELQTKNRETKEDLGEARAQLAKLNAFAASGSDRDRDRAAAEAALNAQQAELKYVALTPTPFIPLWLIIPWLRLDRSGSSSVTLSAR